jgi:lysophospholipase L1-like esterase
MLKSCFLFVLIASQVPVRSIVTVDADHGFIQYSGRFDFSNPKKPRFDWPGTSIQAKFTGTSISAKLSGGKNDFNVIIDGLVKSHLALVDGSLTYELATGLTDGVHTLLLTKRTEGFNGVVTFEGLILPDGQNLIAPPPKVAKKIQFIGDSFTVGYGDEANILSCPDRRPYDNNYLAYGPITARALNADYSVQAVSGYGMVHNYGDTNPISAEPLPAVFDRALFGSAMPKWNFPNWIPDLVVIALGTNDFSTAVKPSQIQYTSAYQAFIAKVRGYFPGVQIICMTYAVDAFQGKYVEAMVKDLITQGDLKIHTVAMPTLLQTDLGCDYHPNLSGQKKYSDVLLPVVKQYLDLVSTIKLHGVNESPNTIFPATPSHSRFFRFPEVSRWADAQGRIVGQE